jgi:hypothetical protein
LTKWKRYYRIPVGVFVLDAIGTLALGIGLFGYFTDSDLFFLEAQALNEYAIPLIIIGLLLMLPMLQWAIRRMKGKN